MSLPQVQVAHVMGKPTPKAPKNTGTPPLILRIPVSNDEQEKAEDKSIMKNITAQISVVSTFHEFVMTVTWKVITNPFSVSCIKTFVKSSGSISYYFHYHFVIFSSGSCQGYGNCYICEPHSVPWHSEVTSSNEESAHRSEETCGM